MPKFPWIICSKSITKNHKAICYNLCDIWVLTKCNKINVAIEIFPLSSLKKVRFFSTDFLVESTKIDNITFPDKTAVRSQC